MENGKEIKRKRLEMGLTQMKLAKYLHVDQTTISKWEKGFSHPDFETGKKLSLFFGIPLSRIYQSEGTIDHTHLPIYQNLRPFHFESNVFENSNQLYVGDHFFSSYSGALIFRESNEETLEAYKDFFAFAVQDNNMKPHFIKDDIVIAKRNVDFSSGDIVIASIGGEDAVLSVLTMHPNGISLAFTGDNRVEFRTTSQYKSGEIKILGTVFELRRKYPNKFSLE